MPYSACADLADVPDRVWMARMLSSVQSWSNGNDEGQMLTGRIQTI